MSEKLKENGMDSNPFIGHISELAYKFVYYTSNVAGKIKEKKAYQAEKCDLQEEKDLANDPVYEPEGSERENDDDEGDNNLEGGDDARKLPQAVEVPKYTFLVHFNFTSSFFIFFSFLLPKKKYSFSLFFSRAVFFL